VVCSDISRNMDFPVADAEETVTTKQPADSAQEIISASRRRSKIEIYHELLRLIGSGVSKPTHLMYECNLSWASLRGSLDAMLDTGLVEISTSAEGKTTYALSEKGYSLLKKLVTIKETISNIPL